MYCSRGRTYRFGYMKTCPRNMLHRYSTCGCNRVIAMRGASNSYIDGASATCRHVQVASHGYADEDSPVTFACWALYLGVVIAGDFAPCRCFRRSMSDTGRSYRHPRTRTYRFERLLRLVFPELLLHTGAKAASAIAATTLALGVGAGAVPEGAAC